VLLMGNLTRDPQLSYTPSQTAVVDFGLAVNRRWTGQDGAQRDETCFVDCRAFGKQAETINKYLTKGRPVFIEGRLTYDTWTAQDGSKRNKHRVTVEGFQFLPGQGSPEGAGAGGAGRSASGQAERGSPAEGGGGPTADPGHPPEEEIPF
jgi:single-strand DNA-binding protein